MICRYQYAVRASPGSGWHRLSLLAAVYGILSLVLPCPPCPPCPALFHVYSEACWNISPCPRSSASTRSPTYLRNPPPALPCLRCSEHPVGILPCLASSTDHLFFSPLCSVPTGCPETVRRRLDDDWVGRVRSSLLARLTEK
ncbi:hypothetical protein F5B18DRAFT_614858 [Nemania serpens]|nr:hypothetical protein F5B18DRAFT_614858 [Nemania serpens]